MHLLQIYTCNLYFFHLYSCTFFSFKQPIFFVLLFRFENDLVVNFYVNKLLILKIYNNNNFAIYFCLGFASPCVWRKFLGGDLLVEAFETNRMGMEISLECNHGTKMMKTLQNSKVQKDFPPQSFEFPKQNPTQWRVNRKFISPIHVSVHSSACSSQCVVRKCVFLYKTHELICR